MRITSSIFFAFSALSIILISIFLRNITKPHPVPILEETFWGPGKLPAHIKTDVTPTKITFSPQIITDLKQRLANTRLTPPLEGIAQEYGMNTDLLKEVLTFWQNKYHFAEREAFLNKYPHFKTNIQGLDIHFMHIKPEDTNGVQVLPLLLLHGWPCSIRDYYDIIPMLTQISPDRDYVFEVIVPSLPGFGLSQAAAKPGLGTLEMAVILKNLMLRLGHDKYYVQGGDWGSIIATNMAAIFKDHVLGLHCSMCIVSTPLSWIKHVLGTIYPRAIVDEKYEERYYPLGKFLKFIMLESGYFHIQATKPDTVGVGLNDSPAGLAAYMLEKFTTYTNRTFKARKDGGLKEVFKYEALLDNIMIYWITNSMTTSMRIYAESITIAINNIQRVPIEVPSACANFRNELIYFPEGVLKEHYVNLVQNNHYDVGGHFIALEMPDKLAADIFSAVTKMRTASKATN